MGYPRWQCISPPATRLCRGEAHPRGKNACFLLYEWGAIPINFRTDEFKPVWEAYADKRKATWAEFGGRHGDESYQFGDLTKAALSKVGAGVAAGVSSITGKETYEFGDLTKAAVDKVGAGVASSAEYLVRTTARAAAAVSRAVGQLNASARGVD